MSISQGTYRVFCAGDDGADRWLVPTSSSVKLSSGSASDWIIDDSSQGLMISDGEGLFLDGDTKNGTLNLVKIGEQENVGSGVYWAIDAIGEYYIIKCLGSGGGNNFYLDGDTKNGSMRLAASTSDSGSNWLMIAPAS